MIRTRDSLSCPSDEVAAGRSTPPVRILYTNTWSSCHGGSSTSLLDIVAHLDRRRYEPHVLCPEPGPLPERLEERGVPVTLHSISPFTRGSIGRFLAEIPWYVRFLKGQRIRLVHANTGCWRRSIAVAARWLRIPLVIHVRNPVKDGFHDFAVRSASRIVTNSDAVGLELRAVDGLRPKTMTIYNAVDLAAYADGADCRGELRAMNRPIVGFVGQLVARKGVKTLIAAMRSVLEAVPDSLLVIVGCAPPGLEEYAEQCRQMVADMGLSDHVRFVGYRRDIPDWMRTFDVFVLPTDSEPFGKVIVEAMAAGCPVVATRVGGIPEIITDEGLGSLVPPGDIQATAAAVIGFLTDRQRAEVVGNSARSHVQGHFGMDRMIGSLQQLYEQVLA